MSKARKARKGAKANLEEELEIFGPLTFMEYTKNMQNACYGHFFSTIIKALKKLLYGILVLKKGLYICKKAQKLPKYNVIKCEWGLERHHRAQYRLSFSCNVVSNTGRSNTCQHNQELHRHQDLHSHVWTSISVWEEGWSLDGGWAKWCQRRSKEKLIKSAFDKGIVRDSTVISLRGNKYLEVIHLKITYNACNYHGK